MDELERLQPHLAAGIDLDATVDQLRDATFNEVLEQVEVHRVVDALRITRLV